ncbi:MAG: hypothetical protein Q8L45_04195 [Xanthomonadaceae bacterium]|nr:hypothetical protein [Xanthomonadaceae bacterium]MDP2185261.1 hypothetical protein [Xanthomonadales bacterium]
MLLGVGVVVIWKVASLRVSVGAWLVLPLDLRVEQTHSLAADFQLRGGLGLLLRRRRGHSRAGDKPGQHGACLSNTLLTPTVTLKPPK